jgi:predicted MFS family arabinose efflux permease
MKPEKEARSESKDPFDGAYIGNIWGWRFSLLGLVLIVLLLGLMIYRHHTLGVPFGFPEEEQPAPLERDTSQTDTLSVFAAPFAAFPLACCSNKAGLKQEKRCG